MQGFVLICLFLQQSMHVAGLQGEFAVSPHFSLFFDKSRRFSPEVTLCRCTFREFVVLMQTDFTVFLLLFW